MFLSLLADTRVFTREVASEGADNNGEVKKGKAAKL